MMHGYENGVKVGVVDPVLPNDEPAVDQRKVAEVRSSVFCDALDLLAGGGVDAAAIGRRVVGLQYLLKTPHGPRTQRELASRLGLSLATANSVCANAGAGLEGMEAFLLNRVAHIQETKSCQPLPSQPDS